MTAPRTRSFRFNVEFEESEVSADEYIGEQYGKYSEGYKDILSRAVDNPKLRRMCEHYDCTPGEALEMALEGHVLPKEASPDPLADYDPDSENVTLSTDLLRGIQPANPEHKVNPDHIQSLPQKTEEKQAVMVAVIRYKAVQIHPNQVKQDCVDMLRIREETAERQYVDDILSYFIPSPVETNPMYITDPDVFTHSVRSVFEKTTDPDESFDSMKDRVERFNDARAADERHGILADGELAEYESKIRRVLDGNMGLDDEFAELDAAEVEE